MTKRVFALLLALMMVLSLAACSDGDDDQSETEAPTGEQTETPAEDDQDDDDDDDDDDGDDDSSAASPGELPEGLCEGPVLLTSVGQSADVNIVNTLLERAGVDVYMNATIEGDSVSGYGTVVLAVGGSSKGLGAAGIDENQEMERVLDVIQAAQADGVTILAVHIGGSARRGTLSDKFIPDAFAAADAAIVLAEGDSDDMILDILTENGVPNVYIEAQTDAIEPLQTLFGS